MRCVGRKKKKITQDDLVTAKTKPNTSNMSSSVTMQPLTKANQIEAEVPPRLILPEGQEALQRRISEPPVVQTTSERFTLEQESVQNK